jgi:hypothetical protein
MLATSYSPLTGSQQAIFNPLNGPRAKGKRLWPHKQSTFTLAHGGDGFGRSMKERAIAIVRVVTTDLEIPLGLLVRDDEDNQIRVAHHVSVPAGYRHWPDSRRYEWRLDAIDRNAVRELTRLS